MNFIHILVLGIVEGLTEFIPVSSTGHLILVGHWMAFSGEEAASFEVFIQLGAILAAAVYYRERFRLLCASLLHPKLLQEKSRLNLIHVFLAIFPAVVAGFLFYKTIKEKLFSPFTVSIGLIAGGLLMVFSEKWFSRKAPVASLDQISYGQALGIGLCQCFSLWPGVSRSGATILGGLGFGLTVQTAADFSFVVAVPVMMLAVGYDLLKSYATLSPSDIGAFLLGGAVAFGVAYFSIAVFLKLLSRFKLAPFGWYRIALGFFVLWFLH